MSPKDDIETVRAEALRKVGRNVVNFQKVEACLKFLVGVSNVQGTPTTATDVQRKRAARIRKQSLGNLANVLHRKIYEGDSEPGPPADLSEMWMSISFKIESDADSIKQRKRALAALVAERNKLIHHNLVHFDHNSPRSCRDLIELLDAQNPRILEQLAALTELIDTFKATIAGVQAWIDSDDFLRQFQSNPTDA